MYVRRTQKNRFKYIGEFPADTPSDVFWFRSQNLDNFLLGMLSGVPIWTALQVVMLWAYANSFGNLVEWASNPIWLAVLCLIVPIIHEFHFFAFTGLSIRRFSTNGSTRCITTRLTHRRGLACPCTRSSIFFISRRSSIT